MKVYQVLSKTSKYQKIKLLDRGDTVFTGYKEDSINEKFLNGEVCNIFCGRDDFF